jgi:hypothetical protein
MRRESADFIGARSRRTRCIKAGYKAAIYPARSKHAKPAQTGSDHINSYICNRKVLKNGKGEIIWPGEFDPTCKN